jgi:hypothetical protein
MPSRYEKDRLVTARLFLRFQGRFECSILYYLEVFIEKLFIEEPLEREVTGSLSNSIGYQSFEALEREETTSLTMNTRNCLKTDQCWQMRSLVLLIQTIMEEH